MHVIGDVVLNGGVVLREGVDAPRWLLKAAEGGDMEAMYLYADCVREKRDGVGEASGGELRRRAEREGKCRSAVGWYRKAAALGHAKAMRWPGAAYASGAGAITGDATTLRWYRKAAALGEVAAMVKVGEMLQRGIGGRVDKVEGYSWLGKAAELGSPAGMAGVGGAILHGEGVEEDMAHGLRWLRKAAENGDRQGMYLLGRCLAMGGVGLRKNTPAAIVWFQKSAELGEVEARRALQELAVGSKRASAGVHAVDRRWAIGGDSGPGAPTCGRRSGLPGAGL
jgi:TPR repeat protein